MHSNAKRLFCRYWWLFVYFFLTIDKSSTAIAENIPADDTAEIGLIKDFNCKIYIRRANIIATSPTAILIIIQNVCHSASVSTPYYDYLSIDI